MSGVGLILGVLSVGFVFIIAAIISIPYMLRKAKRGKMTFVGLRATTKRALVKQGIPRGGKYHWREGGINADVYIQEGMTYDTPNGKLVLVDLDHYQNIIYNGRRPKDAPEQKVASVAFEGACDNDADEIHVVRKNGDHRVMTSLFRRIGGDWLYKLYRDTRANQLLNIGGTWLEVLGRFMPLILILGFIVIIAMLGVVIAVAA